MLSFPAIANDVGLLRTIDTSSQTAGHVPDAGKVQRKMLVPKPSPFTEVNTESALEITPFPLISDHVPARFNGPIAVNWVESEQTD